MDEINSLGSRVPIVGANVVVKQNQFISTLAACL